MILVPGQMHEKHGNFTFVVNGNNKEQAHAFLTKNSVHRGDLVGIGLQVFEMAAPPGWIFAHAIFADSGPVDEEPGSVPTFRQRLNNGGNGTSGTGCKRLSACHCLWLYPEPGSVPTIRTSQRKALMSCNLARGGDLPFFSRNSTRTFLDITSWAIGFTAGTPPLVSFATI